MDILKIKQNGEWVDIPAIVGPKGDKGDQGVQGIQGPAGADGSPGASAYVWIRYAATEPTQDSDMKTTPDAWMGIYSGDSATAPTAYTAYTWYNIKGQTGPVTDVQVNGVSVLNQGVANVPMITSTTPGIAKVDQYSAYGINVRADGTLQVVTASDAQVKSGSAGSDRRPITPSNQHASTFYGLAKAAGDSTQSASSNAVGTYTDSAKVAIQKMLGIYQAPWELIREDTVTNATEADINITVDGNGQAFELTDVICLFETPVQDVESAKGSYGQILCYYDTTKYLSFECSSWTQAANSPAHTCGGILTQNDNIVSVEIIAQGTGGARSSVSRRIYPNLNQSSAQSLFIPSNTLIFTKVNIKAVTGTGHYKLYGKRKWN